MSRDSSQPPEDEGLLLSPFIDEGTEAQRGEVTCSESQASESGFHPRWLECRGHTAEWWQEMEQLLDLEFWLPVPAGRF